jgi:hypothetical protein
MAKPKKSAVYKRALELLDGGKRWGKGRLGGRRVPVDNIPGKIGIVEVPFYDEQAEQFCIIGACARAVYELTPEEADMYDGYRTAAPYYDLLLDCLPRDYVEDRLRRGDEKPSIIYNYNDGEATKIGYKEIDVNFERIEALLTCAEKRALAEEENDPQQQHVLT